MYEIALHGTKDVEMEMKQIVDPTELKPGDHIAVKTKWSNFWWNQIWL